MDTQAHVEIGSVNFTEPIWTWARVYTRTDCASGQDTGIYISITLARANAGKHVTVRVHERLWKLRWGGIASGARFHKVRSNTDSFKLYWLGWRNPVRWRRPGVCRSLLTCTDISSSSLPRGQCGALACRNNLNVIFHVTVYPSFRSIIMIAL